MILCFTNAVAAVTLSTASSGTCSKAASFGALTVRKQPPTATDRWSIGSMISHSRWDHMHCKLSDQTPTTWTLHHVKTSVPIKLDESDLFGSEDDGGHESVFHPIRVRVETAHRIVSHLGALCACAPRHVTIMPHRP